MQPDVDPRLTDGGRAERRVLWTLVAASAILRLAAWGAVAWNDTPPLFDEAAYLARAAGFAELVSAVVCGQPDQFQAAWKQAYGSGVWPPLNALLLSTAHALPGHEIALARLLTALVSALTTGVVYRLTCRLAGSRAGLAAAILHIVYPSFVAFSHLLWSETLYVLFTLLALDAAARLLDARPGVRWRYAVLAGLFVGLAGLARASVLALLVAIVVVLAVRLRGMRGRVVAPAVVIAVSVLVVSPWLAALRAGEGRFVLLSTENGYNLLLGNNPWFTDELNRRQASLAVDERMRATGLSRDEAAQQIAGEFIRHDPLGFAGRWTDRMRRHLLLDWFVLRHVLYCAYPPIAPLVPAVLMPALGFALIVVFAAAARGAVVPGAALRHRSLFLVAALCTAAMQSVSMANGRMSLPIFAILLPLAGAGAADGLARRKWTGLLFLVGAGAAYWALNTSAPPIALHGPAVVSSYYAGAARWIAAWSGLKLGTRDHFELRFGGQAPGEAIQVDLIGDGYAFEPGGGTSRVWRTDESRTMSFFAASDAPPQPITVRLTRTRDRHTAQISPVQAGYWRQERPTGLEDVTIQWRGAVIMTDP